MAETPEVFISVPEVLRRHEVRLNILTENTKTFNTLETTVDSLKTQLQELTRTVNSLKNTINVSETVEASSDNVSLEVTDS